MSTRPGLPALLLALAVAGAADANVYRCVDAQGRTSFQDQPCAADSAGGQITVRELPPKPKVVLEQVADLPLIHHSWLRPPAELQTPVRCDAARCVCADVEVGQRPESGLRLLDAVEALPTLWRVYSTTASHLQSLEVESEEALGVRQQLDASVCRLAIHQYMIGRDYAMGATELLAMPAPAATLPAEVLAFRERVGASNDPEPDHPPVRLRALLQQLSVPR